MGSACCVMVTSNRVRSEPTPAQDSIKQCLKLKKFMISDFYLLVMEIEHHGLLHTDKFVDLITNILLVEQGGDLNADSSDTTWQQQQHTMTKALLTEFFKNYMPTNIVDDASLNSSDDPQRLTVNNVMSASFFFCSLQSVQDAAELLFDLVV